MPIEPGAKLGPYVIAGRLGAGGMGEVYRATDSRLGREVAIKRLPDDVATDPERLRQFHTEARSAAALNHPNVCTLHEIGRENGLEYLVMELVDGRPLSELLEAGSLSIDRVINYGIQIADALAHAHEHQIVHHDLKNANVMVTSAARIKVLDFGLAVQMPREDLTELTRSVRTLGDGGSVAGTLPYLPPEALRGEQVDARGDIWALGVMLYEMAVGRLPFSGRTGMEVASAILRDPPAPFPTDVPGSLAGIIERCLVKDPAQRYQRASDVRAALEAVAPNVASTYLGGSSPIVPFNIRFAGWIAAAAIVLILGVAGLVVATRTRTPAVGHDSKPASIAVLPFHSLGARDDVKFLEVGIPDAIINRLAGASQVRVRPTDAILRFEGQTVGPREAGQTLAAEYVMTGTLQPAGDRLRVSVQLVRATEETPLWGKHYDIGRQDLLTLQDRIAADVATVLPIRMSAAERDRLNPRQTRNPEAFELYLQGRAALVRYTPESTRAAIDSFEKALQIDPRDALAHAGLASASALMRLRFAPEAELQRWLDRANSEAAAALELDPDLAEAHEARAAVARNVEFDWELAIRESDRALALNPSLEQPHFYRAAAFYHFGLFDRAREEVRLGLENNPVSRVEPFRSLGTTALFDSQFVEAESALRSAQGLDNNQTTSTYLAQALYNQGKKGEAEEILAAVTGSAQSRRRAQATLASYLAARNERVKAQALITDVLTGSYMDHHVAYSLGIAQAHVGNLVEARRWLARAAAEGFPCYPWYTNDPLIQPLKSDPAFQEFMRQMHEQFDEYRARYGG